MTKKKTLIKFILKTTHLSEKVDGYYPHTECQDCIYYWLINFNSETLLMDELGHKIVDEVDQEVGEDNK